MENHAYGPTDGTVNGDTTQYIVGNPDAPYINDTLVPQGTRFTSYFANAHPIPAELPRSDRRDEWRVHAQLVRDRFALGR